MSFDPFAEFKPPKNLIENCIKQFRIQCRQLLEEIRTFRNMEGIADWLIEIKEKELKQLNYKISRYQMYLEDRDISVEWDFAKQRAKQRPITEFYVGKLRRMGGRMMGACPFHKDDSPSFVIYANNTFHCFGCSANGDCIDFVMKKDGLDFKSAVSLLAK